jgi:glycosyltransferase, group 2 family protein
MNNIPLLSFITVCYNGITDTCALIESIHKIIHSVSYEIIVVDNASREDEATIIKAHYPTVITLRSQQNLGFSGGNNMGLKIAQGRYLFLINNDTYFESDGIQALIDRLESNPQIGAVSPKIRFAFSPQHIQFAGYTQLSNITMRNEPIGMGHTDDGSFETPHPSPYLHGAAMLIKREVIDRTGLMPEIYFLYYEELDWCTTMTRAGYTLWYEPHCTVFHKESQSTGQQSPLRTFYLTRNRLLYAWRNFTGVRCLLSILYQMTVAAGKNSLVYLLKHRIDLASAVWKGVFAFFSLPNKKN